jgi:hypothetical protein
MSASAPSRSDSCSKSLKARWPPDFSSRRSTSERSPGLSDGTRAALLMSACGTLKGRRLARSSTEKHMWLSVMYITPAVQGWVGGWLQGHGGVILGVGGEYGGWHVDGWLSEWAWGVSVGCCCWAQLLLLVGGDGGQHASFMLHVGFRMAVAWHTEAVAAPPHIHDTTGLPAALTLLPSPHLRSSS